MQIEEIKQKAAIAQVASVRPDRPEAPELQGDPAAKQTADKVELSSYMPVVPSSKRQSLTRIDDLKSQINSGSYQVPGKAVAEKMLSKIVMRSFA